MRIRILVIFLTIHWHEFLLPLHRHFLFFEKSLPMMSIVRNTTLTLVPRSCKFLYTNSLSRNTSRNISFPLRNASAFLHNRIRSSTGWCPVVQILRNNIIFIHLQIASSEIPLFSRERITWFLKNLSNLVEMSHKSRIEFNMIYIPRKL